jgi:hypothetical protein
MAKTQTFTDKSKKKGAGADMIAVKVITTDKTGKGTFKFSERFIKVKDLADVEQAVKA